MQLGLLESSNDDDAASVDPPVIRRPGPVEMRLSSRGHV